MKTVMFNPYTGTPRHPSDIASDPSGLLILEPGAPLRAAAQVVALEPEGPDGHGVNWLAGKRPKPGDLLYGGDAVARALAAKNEAETNALKAVQEADELRAALAAETRRWEEAMRMTWQMVDPLKPAGTPGSYARGQDSGIVAALTTLRANLKPPNAKLCGPGREEV